MIPSAALKRVKSLERNPLVREGSPLLGLYWLYSTIRWFVARESPYEAFQNAFKIIQLEKQLGIFHEPTIQRWFVDHGLGVIQFANTFYSLGYFPVLILTAVLLYRLDPERFHTFKLAFLLGLGFALICFSLFPLAPPRMLPAAGFLDTQQRYGDGLYNQKFVLSFYNPYAAMPSMHFGWALLVGIVARSSGRRSLKVIGTLYPCCMAVVIVLTGHHYFLDIVGGGVVVGLAYGLVKMIHPAKEPALITAGLNADRACRKNSPKREHSLFANWPAAHRTEQHKFIGPHDLIPFDRRPPL